MRRLVFAAVAVVTAGGAIWLREQSARTSSFGPYTDAQLDTLETGYRTATRAPPAPGPITARSRPGDASSTRSCRSSICRRSVTGAIALGASPVVPRWP